MKIKKFQVGGSAPAVPAEDPTMAAAPEQGAAMGGAEDQLAQLAGQLLEMLLQQLGDPQAVMMVLQAAMEMLQSSAQEQAPVFKRGGKMAKRSCKKSCGGNIKK